MLQTEIFNNTKGEKVKIQIHDRLYGTVEVDEPVLIELIDCPSMQRLKDISQMGLPDSYYHLKGFSRYEHSLGVFLLLRMFGASLYEQVAGLIHDVSHAPFSHIIDLVMYGASGEESWQDDHHVEFVLGSEIPGILEKHQVSLDVVLDCPFGLLDRKIPDLCADRIDYALRELAGNYSSYFLEHLRVKRGLFVFDDKKAARLFAEKFLERQKDNWASFEAISRYYNFARLLRLAIKCEVFTLEDIIHGKESPIIKKLLDSGGLAKSTMKKMEAKSLRFYERSELPQVKKFRYVDPLFCGDGGVLERLTDVDLQFKAELDEARMRNKQGVYPAILF